MAAAGSDAGSRFLGFLVTAYLARVIGPPGFGLISIGLSVLGYAVLLAGPGLNVLGTRQVAASGGTAAEFSADVIALRAQLGAATACLASLLLLPVYGLSAAWATTAVFALSAIPMAASPDWYAQGRRAMGWLAASRLASAGVYLLLVVNFQRNLCDFRLFSVPF